MRSDLQSVAVEPDHALAPGQMRFDVFATRILYVVSFALGAVSAAQTDLWWLLRAGQDTWRTHHVSLVESYSHTANGRFWMNHEWLWEAIAYAVHHVGGMPLLSAWTGATVAGTAWVLRRCSGAGGYIVPLTLGLALPLMSVSWSIRPQATSMLLFAVTMLLLIQERYVWIPPLLLVWANLHAQVGMGGALLSVALAAALLDLVRLRTATARRRALHLAGSTVASALATLATPLGPRLWRYVVDAKDRASHDRIAEWAATYHSVAGSALLWPLLVIVVVAVVRRRDKLAGWGDRVPLFAALAVCPLAIMAVRNLPFFVIAVVPLLMTLLEFRTGAPIGTVSRSRGALAGFAAVTAAGVLLVWIAQPPQLGWHPVEARLAAALRQCPGPLYNIYDDGAALIWFVPEVKVFADNRYDPYPGAVMDASMGLAPSEYRATFERFGIRCALLRQASGLTPALRQDGWTPTYEDGRSIVLVPPPSPRATSATE